MGLFCNADSTETFEMCLNIVLRRRETLILGTINETHSIIVRERIIVGIGLKIHSNAIDTRVSSKVLSQSSGKVVDNFLLHSISGFGSVKVLMIFEIDCAKVITSEAESHLAGIISAIQGAGED